MILVRNIRLPLSCPDPEQEAVRQAYRTLRLRGNAPAQAGVAKLSVDARHGTPVLVYTIAITLHDEGEESALAGASPCVCFTRKPDFTFPRGGSFVRLCDGRLFEARRPGGYRLAAKAPCGH